MSAEEGAVTPIKEQSEWKFQLTRVYTILCLNVLYALVSFQKQCPSVVAEDIAATYKCTTKELGVFSSVYFYPYAFTQPFAGLLADVIDPALVVGCSCMVAGIGSIIVGFSRSLALGIFGRILVGLGCGPTYVSTCRVITTWFKPKQVPTIYGILVASAGIGGILAAAPLALFLEKFSWPIAFWGIGGLGCAVSAIVLAFVRGNPMNKGFKAVNEELASPTAPMPVKQKLLLLWVNFKTVVVYGYFWLVTIYNMLASGPYFNIAGYWGGPYLVDVLGYSKKKKGLTLLSISIGLILGSLTIPNVSTLLHNKKWILFVSSVIAFIVCLIFVFLGENFPLGAIWALYILVGTFTGSAVGIGNFFLFLSSAVFQQISTSTVPIYGHNEVNHGYTWKGYKYGLWLFSAITLGVSAILIVFAKDNSAAQKKDEQAKDIPNDADMPSDDIKEDVVPEL